MHFGRHVIFFISAALALCAATYFLSKRPTASTADPVLEFTTDFRVDVGILTGPDIQLPRTVTFGLRNASTGSLDGVKAVASCGCTNAAVLPANIPPGGTATLTAVLNPPPRGDIAVEISIVSQQQLLGVAHVVGSVSPSEEICVLGCRRNDSKQTLEVSLARISAVKPEQEVDLLHGDMVLGSQSVHWKEVRAPTAKERGAWIGAIEIRPDVQRDVWGPCYRVRSSTAVAAVWID